MSVNGPLGNIVTINKTAIPEGDKWRDFYKHVMMGVASIDRSLPEPSQGPIMAPITPKLEIIPYMKLMNKIQLLAILGKIEPKEVARLVSMLDSPDPESWTLAERRYNKNYHHYDRSKTRNF